MGVLHGSIPWLAIAVRQNKNSQKEWKGGKVWKKLNTVY